MKGDGKLRSNIYLLTAVAVICLMVPSPCLAGQDSTKAGSTKETERVSGANSDSETNPVSGAVGADNAATDAESESQAKFDALMKTVEETEQNTCCPAIEVPTTCDAVTGTPVTGDLNGSVQTNALEDDKPLFAMPGTATKAQLPNSVSTKPSIESAKLSYKNGRWKEALDTIAQLKQTDKTHYYAGLCYQGQGQLRAAAGEFQWVASFSKDPLLKYNATRALVAVGSYSRTRAAYQGQGNNFARTTTGGMRSG